MTLQPSADAQQMADFILELRELRREILEETITAAEQGQILESGRTICGPEVVLPPAVRYPRAVELQRCPVTAGAGVIHSHVSRPELHRPQHSIPDTANVMLEHDVVCSVVAGLEVSNFLLEPEDHDAGHRAFETAFGMPVDSPQDVIRAIDAGQIESFSAVRRRLQRELDPLFVTYDTPFPDLEARAAELSLAAAAPHHVHAHGGEPLAVCGPARRLVAQGYGPGYGTGASAHAGRATKLRKQQARVAGGFRQTVEESDMSSEVRAQVIGQVAGAIVDRGLGLLL